MPPKSEPVDHTPKTLENLGGEFIELAQAILLRSVSMKSFSLDKISVGGGTEAILFAKGRMKAFVNFVDNAIHEARRKRGDYRFFSLSGLRIRAPFMPSVLFVLRRNC